MNIQDVDSLTEANAGRLPRGALTHALPSAVLKLIKTTGKVVEGKRAVVMGSSKIVASVGGWEEVEGRRAVVIGRSRIVVSGAGERKWRRGERLL